MIIPELELPVCLNGDGTEGNPGRTVKGFFNPTEIASYHDGYFPDTGIFIYLKGGQPIQIALTMEAYQETIRQYWNEIARQQAKMQNGQSIKQKLGIRN